MQEIITYFDKPGRVNTRETITIARDKAEKSGIDTIIMTSTSGYSANIMLEMLDGVDVTLVVICANRSHFSREVAEEITKKGHKILYTADINYSSPEVVDAILRKFCEGVKMCLEVTLMATNEGLVPIGREVIALGGTGSVDFEEGGGVDTALVIETMKSDYFLSSILPRSLAKREGRKIKEILCKPR